MGQFNPYLWKIYANGEGKEAIGRFRSFIEGDFEGYDDFIASLMEAYCPDREWIDDIRESILNNLDQLHDRDGEETAPYGQDLTTGDMILEYYQDYLDEYKSQAQAHWRFSIDLACISTFLAWDYPQSFIPYYFPACFNVVQRVAEYFGIELPAVPSKGQKEKRVLFYAELSDVLNDFREENGLEPEELWALLYDYGPKVVGGTDRVMPAEELKDAHRVFVFGTAEWASRREPKAGQLFMWQGSPDMKPGDIAVLYQWKPVSSFVSIWRAVSVGYNDPLFRHHRVVCYSAVCGIPAVSWNELKADEIFSQTPLVRSKMTQMDGARMKNSEYMHLLEMAAKNGKLPDNVPEMPVYSELEAPEMKLERDVEVFYLEGLLKRLGWDDEDYERQIPLRGGRQNRVFPDYVINYRPTGPEAEIVLEAKLTIPSERQAKHDKGQAKAYARLLRARALVLVSKEGIWLAESYDDFDKMTAYTWGELQDADLFDEVYQVIGKGNKGKKKH